MHWAELKAAAALREQSLLWDSVKHFSNFSPGNLEQKQLVKLMDHTGLLVLLLVLNLSGAFCAVLHWAEFNEAEVRLLFENLHSQDASDFSQL